MIRRYTVFGDPIEHSRSPMIHNLFAEQVQRRIEYTKTRANEDTFEQALHEFRQSGAQGCNVTAPLKGLAFELCDKMSEEARLAQAVNTIKFLPDGTLAGFNTDGSGLIADIKINNETSIAGKRILIAGAGGAVRGILLPLLAEEPADILICNRTLEKAQALATLFSSKGSVRACSYEDIEHTSVDIIINATGLGLTGEKPPLPDALVSSTTVLYDMTYSSRSTAFLDWGRQCAAALTSDGTGMLLEQAADAFFIWEGVRPKTRLIIPKLT